MERQFFCRTSGSLDCAFVERLDSSKTVSNVLPSGSTLSYAAPVYAYQNERVYMYGCVTTSASGLVVATDRDTDYGSYVLYDMLVANMGCANGDSGAPILSKSFTPVGILSGYNASDGTACIVRLKDIINTTGALLNNF